MSSRPSRNCKWLERPDHPLLNNVVLDLVFQNLKKKELRKCRLVCKTWNVLTIPFTRKAFQVNIYGNNNPKKKHGIQKFVDVFRSNKLGIPFTRFGLGSFCTTDGVGQEFLKLCGDTVTDIEFLEKVSVVEDISELLKSTPKLESFQIPVTLQSRTGEAVKLFPDGLESSKSKLTSLTRLSSVHVETRKSPEKQIKTCPTFLEELITAAQNIYCLDISRSDPKSSYEVLSMIEKLGRESFIQELKMSVVEGNYVNLPLRMTIKPNGLRLKTFHYISRYHAQVDKLVLLQLIPSFKDTLESLFLNVPESRCPNFIEFPKMSRLTTMSLTWVPKDLKCTSLNLNETFPVMRELQLWQLPEQPNDEFFPDSDPCPKMNAFGLFGLHKSSGMTINGFNQMMNVFPNLSELSIRIEVDGVEIIRQIWSQMTQLKSLNIDCQLQITESVDSVLTGISTHGLEEIKDIVNNLKRMRTDVKRREIILELRDQYSTLPSIGNLINLNSLSMKFSRDDDYEDTPREGKFITDLSGYLGLYSMERLRHLNVRNCKLSKTCCEMLKKEMGLETWDFTNLEYDDIIPSMEKEND